MTDDFKGDDANLVQCIEALLALDSKGVLIPHGVGGHARVMLSAAAVRLASRDACADAIKTMFLPWPKGEMGPTDEPESQYRFGYNTAIEDVLDVIAASAPRETEMTDEQKEAIEWAAGQAYSYAKPLTGESLMQKRWSALNAILQAATHDPADDQSFVGKWRTTIKAMPDTYEHAATPTGTTMTIDIINSAADATMSPDEREAFDKFSDDTKQRLLNQILKRAGTRDTVPDNDRERDIEHEAYVRGVDAGQALMRATTRDAPSQAAQDVLAERQRQVTAEGWTPEHDDEHNNQQLAAAAACYALCAYRPEEAWVRGPARCVPPKYWPWVNRWWKPQGPRRDLVKAGALILAEIERLDRAYSASKGDGND